MLSPEERAAATFLLEKQLELAGRQLAADCRIPYTVSHIRLGSTITVTLTGPEGQREGTAIGLEDLPNVYSQLVRSLVGSREVVDRSNVTLTQASALRVHSDSYPYARLGYGGIFGDRTYGTPSFGFGYRAELDSFAVDVSFLNFQVASSSAFTGPNANAGSLLKLSGLYFLNGRSSASPYFGGGLSWGGRNFTEERPSYSYNGRTVYSYSSDWHGSGLQGELTAGYEFARTTTIRAFVQADAILPFYNVTRDTYTSSNVTSSDSRYSPSLIMSVGLGWQRNRK
jgi:hypothetical protein